MSRAFGCILRFLFLKVNSQSKFHSGIYFGNSRFIFEEEILNVIFTMEIAVEVSMRKNVVEFRVGNFIRSTHT